MVSALTIEIFLQFIIISSDLSLLLFSPKAAWLFVLGGFLWQPHQTRGPEAHRSHPTIVLEHVSTNAKHQSKEYRFDLI